MPVNPSYQYVNAEEEYQEASTTQQKIKALKKMLTTAPTHKGADKLRGQIRVRIAKLKRKIEKESQLSKGGHSLSVKKEGAAQIVFVSLPNAGKSYILEKLSKSKVEQEKYPFTTKIPQVRMMDADGAKLQGVEVPAIYKGFYEKDNGPEIFSIVRNADFIVLVVDGREPIKPQINTLFEEFSKANIELTRKRRGQKEFITFIPAIVLVNLEPNFSDKINNLDILNFKERKVKEIIRTIWGHLCLVRVYTRTNGVVAKKPVVMRKNSTIKQLAKRVHKDFVKNFKYAKIWGSGSFPGQQVGMEYLLKDKDVVELYTV